MTTDSTTTAELRDLLDTGASVAESVAGAVTETAPEPSPTVLAMDRWTKRAGERVATQWRETLTQSAEIDDLARLDKMADPHIAADAIETLLSPAPRLAQNPEDATRAAWWKQLLDSPETAGLRSRTVASPAVAEIAAAEIASQYAAYAVEHEPEPGDGDGKGEPGEDESTDATVDRIRSTRAALKAATEAADAAEAIGEGLGLGQGAATNASELARYTRRLRESPNLAAIMRAAGRFIAKAQRLQRERTDLPGMEITGVELSGDLARALPLEAAQVAGVVPELETLALLKLAERRVMSYKRLRREPMAMGPIVVSVDESGSMHGERIAAAKGLALAMASIARAQKRPFMLVGWSSTDQVRVVKGDAGPDAIVEWLESMFNGGTDLQGPLWRVTTDYWPEERWGQHADHIIITDDDVGLPDWLYQHYRTWAASGNVRTFGIGVGVRHTTTLARFCDGGVWALPSLDLDNAAVDVVLSIGPQAQVVK